MEQNHMRGGYFKMHADGTEDLPHMIETPEPKLFFRNFMGIPERQHQPALAMHWYDGGMRPHRPRELDSKTAMPREGTPLRRRKGKMLTGYYGARPVFAGEDLSDFQPPRKPCFVPWPL